MKNLIIIILAICSYANKSLAQTTSAKDSVEFPAEYPGGTEALSDFLADKLKYPESMREKGLQGTVEIVFIINEDGQLDSMKVAKSAGITLDNEAIRVLSLMPNWKPAITKGKPIKMYYTLPITFALAEDGVFVNANIIITKDTCDFEPELKEVENIDGFIKYYSQIKLPRKPVDVYATGVIKIDGSVSVNNNLSDNSKAKKEGKYDAEAKRLLRLMKFKPLMVKGIVVEMPFTVTMVFSR
jgi:TonB family protein